jgi:hypothetical protein
MVTDDLDDENGPKTVDFGRKNEQSISSKERQGSQELELYAETEGGRRPDSKECAGRGHSDEESRSNLDRQEDSVVSQSSRWVYGQADTN